MEFLNELDKFLFGQGFRRINTESGEFWVRDAEQRLQIIELRQEALPGQPRMSLPIQEKYAKEMENRWMIRSGRPADRLVLMIVRGIPEKAFTEELSNYPNIWCIDKENGTILLFEHQRPDYYGLRKKLEDFICVYCRQEAAEKKRELTFLLSPVNTIIVLANVLVFLVLSLLGNVSDAGFMKAHGAMAWEEIVGGKEYYRLFTSTFLHFGADHLFQNMLLLLLIGCRLERMTGGVRYILIYLGSGVAASLFSLFITLASEPYMVSAGASGAIFGVMGGVLALVLKDMIQKRRGRIKEVGLSGMLFMIMGTLSYGFSAAGVDNAAHLGGLAAGFILTEILMIRK